MKLLKNTQQEIIGAKESIKLFEINLTIQKIQIMKSTQFKNIAKHQTSKAAINYLKEMLAKGKKENLFMIQYLK